MKTLRDISCGQSATVVKIQGEGGVRRRIMDMGITRTNFSGIIFLHQS